MSQEQNITAGQRTNAQTCLAVQVLTLPEFDGRHKLTSVAEGLRKGAQRAASIGLKRARLGITQTCDLHKLLFYKGLVLRRNSFLGMPLALSFWEAASVHTLTVRVEFVRKDPAALPVVHIHNQEKKSAKHRRASRWRVCGRLQFPSCVMKRHDLQQESL
jgi:hypothetical protein